MSENTIPPAVEARLQALEARLAELEGRKAPVIERSTTRTLPDPIAAPATSATSPSPSPSKPWDFLIDSGEGWLGRAGVTLLVVGMILLFQYAVKQGWLTQEMRIAIGLVVGAGLLGAGAFLFTPRRLYRQILMGGGIAILFITGLAATELYHLISGTFALIFFAVVAGVALTIASRQNESVIASIGVTGALIPPSFLLYDTVPGSVLWLYLAIIIAWTGVLLTARAWERPLLFAALLSVGALCHHVPANLNTQAAAVIAVTACWVCYAALPLLRARLFHPGDGAPLSPLLLLALPSLITLSLGFVADEFVLPGARAFDLSAALDATGFALIAWMLHRYRAADGVAGSFQWRGDTYRIDAFGAAVCAFVIAATAALMAASETPFMFVTAAVIAAAVMFAARRVDVELLTPLAHGMFAVLAFAFLSAGDRFSRLDAFDKYAVTFTLVTAIAAFVATRLQRRDERLTYWIAIYFAAHVLMATELADVKSAPWLASAAYGVVGSVLLIKGLSMRQLAVQRAGMVSLALLVARLFLYDLAQVNVGVRIVLFMVCGFAFLALSYLVKARRFAISASLR